MEISSKFKKFILCLLGRANLKRKTKKLLTTDEMMTVYLRAFTHKSFSENNYEVLEFYGDAAVNLSATKYIRERFPRADSVKFITKFKHFIIGERWLPLLANTLQLYRFIRYRSRDKFRVSQMVYLTKPVGSHHPGMMGIIKNINKSGITLKLGDVENVNVQRDQITELEFHKILEDVFESFFGALIHNSREHFSRGVGYAIVYDIIKSVYDEYDLDLQWRVINDPKSRLKELYDKLGWNIKTLTNEYYNRKTNKYVISLFGYMKGDRTPIEENKEHLASVSNIDSKMKDQLWRLVSNKALYNLRTQYGIMEPKISPYTLEDKELPNELVKIPSHFLDHVRQLLDDIDITTNFALRITQNKYGMIWLSSFIHPSYNAYINFRLNKFIGISIIDFCVADYIFEIFDTPEKDKDKEGSFTNIKHNIMNNIEGNLSSFIQKTKLYKYVKYGEEIKAIIDLREKKLDQIQSETFKAFVGCLYEVVYLETKLNGVAYVVCYNFVRSILTQVNLSQRTLPKTTLRNYYRRLGWKYDENVEEIFDKEKPSANVKIYGYPLGNKKEQPSNRKLLAEVTTEALSEARNLAVKKAVQELRKYGIY
jgi:dsRNA-specific ribonuclease